MARRLLSPMRRILLLWHDTRVRRVAAEALRCAAAVMATSLVNVGLLDPACVVQLRGLLASIRFVL